jgi:hypothetical protein
MYNPIIFKLPESNIINDFIKEEENVIFSSNQTLPLFSLGFHHFIERTREAMNITNKLETKNDFYFVVNPFETNISNHDDTVINLSKIYFNINSDKPEILSTEFYKMWEINFLFDIINNKKLTYASIGKDGNSFLQSIIYFREKMLNIDVSNDKIFLINQNNEEEDIEPKTLKHFTGLYNINNFNTFTNKQNKISQKKMKTLKKEIVKNKKYANLVIANGTNTNSTKEQDYYKVIISDIFTTLSILEKDGNFILKIYDTFTLTTIKLIWLVCDFFEESYIYKPLFSRPSETEKYLICKKFKYNNDNEKLENVLEKLQDILKSINDDNNINILMPNSDLPNDWLNIFRYINIKLVNIQQIIINDIVRYIKDNNYFGDKYHEYRNNQIEASKWWIEMFYPPSNNLYIENKKNIDKIIENILNMNILEIKQFVEQLI